MKFVAKMGHDLDMGTFRFVPSTGDLANTTAELKIGLGDTTKCALSSAQIDPRAVMHWDPSTGDLSIDLLGALIDEIGVGVWTYEMALRTATGRRRHLRDGILQILPALP